VGEDGVCFSCGAQYALDDEMAGWLAEFSGTKTEMSRCWKCGADNSLETVYHKNHVDGKWQAAHGECRACGMRFIV
jgi:ribosomal protein L40E